MKYQKLKKSFECVPDLNTFLKCFFACFSWLSVYLLCIWLIKSLHYTRDITQKCLMSDEADFHTWQHNSEEILQCWPNFGNTVPDLTGIGIKLETSRAKSDVFNRGAIDRSYLVNIQLHQWFLHWGLNPGVHCGCSRSSIKMRISLRRKA